MGLTLGITLARAAPAWAARGSSAEPGPLPRLPRTAARSTAGRSRRRIQPDMQANQINPTDTNPNLHRGDLFRVLTIKERDWLPAQRFLHVSLLVKLLVHNVRGSLLYLELI